MEALLNPIKFLFNYREKEFIWLIIPVNLTLSAQPVVNVTTLSELRSAAQVNNFRTG